MLSRIRQHVDGERKLQEQFFPKAAFQRVCKTFQSVSKEFQSVLKGFQSISKWVFKGFQSVSKGFEK